MEQISQYIISKYPNSCLAHNTCDGYPYTRDELIEECSNFFYHEKLGWCGCGAPKIAKRCVRDFLEIVRLHHDDEEKDYQKSYEHHQQRIMDRFGASSIYDNELFLCLAYALDAAGFTEHGSSIGGAWLTEEGQMFLKVLRLQNLEDD